MGTSTGGVRAADNGGYFFSQTASAGGTESTTGYAAIGSGTTMVLNPSTYMIVSGQCKIESAITLTTTTTICSWTLPNSAQPHGYQCQGTYSTTTTAITITLGTQFADSPTTSNHNAMLFSAAGVPTFGTASNTGTTAVQTVTGPAVSTGSNIPWQASGTFTSSATSGTFVIYGTASTSSDASIAAGSTCTLY
jgi:hypothetical protein